MGKKSKMSVLKRQREARKIERAAAKRERREQRESSEARVATREDLEAYGTTPRSGDTDKLG